jgi:hypothetical protein
MAHIIYNLALVAHIVGITLMAGTTFIDYLTFRQFWKNFPSDKVKGLVIEDLLNKLQRFMGIGMAVILISGVVMMIYLHQVWGQQIWFRIKMGFLVLIIINGLGFRRILGSRLRKAITSGLSGPVLEKKLSTIERNVLIVHVFQMLFFIIIFALSVFKFN